MRGQERILITQQKLVKERLDGLIVVLSVNVLALFGYWPGNHAAAGIIPASGKPILLVPQTELLEAERFIEADMIELRSYEYESVHVLRGSIDAMLSEALPRAMKDLGLLAMKIGLELSCEDGATGKIHGDYKFASKATWDKLKRCFCKAAFVDAAGVIGELRSIKTMQEIEQIKKTIRIAEMGLSSIYHNVMCGMTETHISAMIEAEVLCNTDAYYSRAFTATYSGARSAAQWVHYAYSSHRVVKDNEVVIVELGCVSDGYWCDLTRCTVAGEPSDEINDTFKIVKEAQERGLAAVKVGEPLSRVNNACYDFYKSKGYGEEFYKHACGHGTGFNYHEGPPLHAASDVLMKEGMVLCIEPGLYFEGQFGIRTEDIFVATKSGAKRLSKHPDSLINVG